MWAERISGVTTRFSRRPTSAATIPHSATTGTALQGTDRCTGFSRCGGAFARLDKLVPGELGVVVEGDVGRVWLDGEDSNRWHPSYAAGVILRAFPSCRVLRGGHRQELGEHLFHLQGANELLAVIM